MPPAHPNKTASGKVKIALAALALFAFGLCSVLLACHRFFQGGQSYEFCHYSEIASNLLGGNGFTSAAQTPGNLAFIDAYGRPQPWPLAFESSRFPLQALLTAGMQSIFGTDDFALLAAGSFAHGLWSASVFGCGLLFFSPEAAFAAAFLWAANPALTAVLVPGGFPDLLAGLLCTLAAFLFIKALLSGSSRPVFFAIGVLCGCAYLARFTVELFLPLFPLFAIGVQGFRKGLTSFSCLAAGALLPVLPWTAYVHASSGTFMPPLFWTQLAANTITGPIPWHEYRLFGPADFNIPGAAALIARKWLSNLSASLHDLPSLWFLAPASVAALACAAETAAKKGQLSTLLLFHLAALAAQLLGFSLLRHETLGAVGGRYYLWLGPIALLCACRFMLELGEKMRGIGPRKALAGFAALQLAAFAYSYARIDSGTGHRSGKPVPFWPEITWARSSPPSSVFLSNLPNQIAWYGKRPVISLPPDPRSLPQLMEKHPADYLVLSPSPAGEPWNYPAWKEIARLEPQSLDRLRSESGFSFREENSGALLFAREKTTSAPARSRPEARARALSRSAPLGTGKALRR